jgi:hypothetical protein
MIQNNTLGKVFIWGTDNISETLKHKVEKWNYKLFFLAMFGKISQERDELGKELAGL